MPEELQTQLRAAMEAAGIPVPKSKERWAKAMTALKVHVTPWFLTWLAPHVVPLILLQSYYRRRLHAACLSFLALA